MNQNNTFYIDKNDIYIGGREMKTTASLHRKPSERDYVQRER